MILLVLLFFCLVIRWVPNSLLEVHTPALKMANALAPKENMRFIVVFCCSYVLLLFYLRVFVASSSTLFERS